jgi:hypothetical protein
MVASRAVADADDRDGGVVISDSDRDSLHSLPLAIIPLKTPALTRARLIKNVRLDSVVELFEDAAAGSGQIDIDSLPTAFAWVEGHDHPDLAVLRALALLPSFDVYSLRVSLRDIGIRVNDYSTLRLSRQKNEELTEYMTAFTRPLIRQIYGETQVKCASFEELLGLFRDPDVKKAYEKLKLIAGRLQIPVAKVPEFLEDYGDIFLSLSYYRQALDAVRPRVNAFMETLTQMRRNWQLKKDSTLMHCCEYTDGIVGRAMANTQARFDAFDRASADLWGELSAERFRAIQRLVTSCHITVGGTLCTLSVKMDAWHRIFPTPDAGGPLRRAEILIKDIRPGMDKLHRLEDTAPPLTSLA